VKNNRKTACIIEAIVAILLFGIGLYVRVLFYAPYGEPVLGTTIIADSCNVYMERAKVTGQGFSDLTFHQGIHSVYILLLRSLFFVFGNLWPVGIVAQIALTFLAAFVLYFATRKVAGSVAALLMLGFVSVFPLMLTGSLVYGPQMLYLLFAGIVLYAINGFISEGKQEGNGLLKLGFLSVGVAILLGALIYLGIAGILLLPLVLLFAAFCHKNGGVLSWILISLLTIVLTGAAVCGLVFMQGYTAESTFAEAFSEWIRLQAGNLIFEPWTYMVCAVLLLYYPLCLISLLVKVIKNKLFYTVDGSVDDLFNITIDEEDAVVAEEAIVETEVIREAVTEPKAEEPAPAQVTFIENPLPLPKKHVKKRLDFAFEPAPEEMNYDYDVDDNDTYDIE